MCGRFVRTSPREAIVEEFGVSTPAEVDLRPRYNVCPGEQVAAIISDGREKRLGTLRWGFLPSITKKNPSTMNAINARSETVATMPAFRVAFRRRRCLIVADGFYEWRKEGTKKVPYFFHLGSGGPFAFAGLWERGRHPQGLPLYTCTILTCPANELISAVHDRMPVILPPIDREVWLDPGFDDAEALRRLLKPYPSSKMEAYRVHNSALSPRGFRDP